MITGRNSPWGQHQIDEAWSILEHKVHPDQKERVLDLANEVAQRWPTSLIHAAIMIHSVMITPPAERTVITWDTPDHE